VRGVSWDVQPDTKKAFLILFKDEKGSRGTTLIDGLCRPLIVPDNGGFRRNLLATCCSFCWGAERGTFLFRCSKWRSILLLVKWIIAHTAKFFQPRNFSLVALRPAMLSSSSHLSIFL